MKKHMMPMKMADWRGENGPKAMKRAKARVKGKRKKKY